MTYEPVTLDHLLEHQSWALRLARQLVREENEAEELVQRTWIAAMQRPPSSGRGARAWIRKVILNLARERHRRATTRARHELASHDPDLSVPDAADAVSREEIRGRLAERLMAMQEPYRSVLTLRFYEDLSSSEIATRLGMPAGTVRWRLKVGLDQLREDLDRESHGDRQRWVSSLLLLLPREASGTAPEPALGSGALAWVAGLSIVASLSGLTWLLWPRADAPAPDPARTSALVSSDVTPPGQGLAAPGGNAARNLAPETPGLGATGAGADAQGLAVRVRDERGRPVEGARLLVLARGRADERARTDARGESRVPLHASDVGALGVLATRERVALLVLADGHAAALWHVDGSRARTAPLEVTLASQARPLSGRLVDAAGAPVAGAQLAWYEPTASLSEVGAGDFPGPVALTATSDAEGHFTLPHVGAPGATLLVRAAGFAPVSLEVEHLESELVFVLRPGATVEGRVLLPDGRPAADVHVGSEPLHKASEWAASVPGYDPIRRGFPEETRTDAEGRFKLEHLTPGGRTLWAGDARGAASTSLELGEGDTRDWNPVLGSEHSLRLCLVDEDEAPLAGWMVVLRRPGSGGTWWIRRLVVDDQGRVETHECPAGDVFLDVLDRSGLGPSHASRRIAASAEELVLRIDTRSLATVRGLLLDAAGAPELEGTLQLISLRTGMKSEPARESDGRFAMRLPPGAYSAVMRQAQGAARLASFELAAGAEHDLGTLQLGAPGTLRLVSGALRNGTARTPSYTLYAHFDEQRFLECAQGELDGEAMLTLFPGRYRVLLFDGAGNPPSAHFVTIASFEEARLAP